MPKCTTTWPSQARVLASVLSLVETNDCMISRAWWTYLCIFINFLWTHDEVIKWKHFPRFWPFVRGIRRSQVNSPHKGQWRGALIFSLICAWTNSWANTGHAGDLRHHRAHYAVIVNVKLFLCTWSSRTATKLYIRYDILFQYMFVVHIILERVILYCWLSWFWWNYIAPYYDWLSSVVTLFGLLLSSV